jgi:hypothetical protein
VALVRVRHAAEVTLAFTAVFGALIAPRIASGSADVYVAARACTGHSLRPTTIILACGDGGMWASAIAYSSYGGKDAEASVRLSVIDCVPNCAAGHAITRSGTLPLYGLVSCPDGRRYYRLARDHFTARRPANYPATEVWDIAPFNCR